MHYLKVILISFAFIFAPSHGFSADSTGKTPVVEQKSSAMKELRQKFSHDHQMQRYDTHKKVVQHPKTNSSWIKKQST